MNRPRFDRRRGITMLAPTPVSHANDLDCLSVRKLPIDDIHKPDAPALKKGKQRWKARSAVVEEKRNASLRDTWSDKSLRFDGLADSRRARFRSLRIRAPPAR